MAITPNQTIDIQHGTPNHESVTIKVGEVVELHNTDSVDYYISLSYKKNNSDDDYPLSVYLPHGGMLYFSGDASSTCEYNIDSAAASGAKGKGPLTGPYTITVNS